MVDISICFSVRFSNPGMVALVVALIIEKNMPVPGGSSFITEMISQPISSGACIGTEMAQTGGFDRSGPKFTSGPSGTYFRERTQSITRSPISVPPDVAPVKYPNHIWKGADHVPLYELVTVRSLKNVTFVSFISCPRM